MTPLALVAALSAVVIGLHAHACFRSIGRADGLDYAQIGQEIAAGRGFTSRQLIYRLHLEFLKTHQLLDAPWPNLHRFPLPSLSIAAFIRLVGHRDLAVILPSSLYVAGSALLVFLLAGRLGGSGAAWIGSLVFLLNPDVLEATLSGLGEPPLMFFLLLTLLLVSHGPCPGPAWPWFAAGVAAGLMALARSDGLVLAPPILAYACLRARGGRARLVLLFVAGMLLPLAPWCVRNWLLTGDPLFSLHRYYLLPADITGRADRFDWTLPWNASFVSPWEFFRAHTSAVLHKVARNVMHGSWALISGLHAGLLWPFVLAGVVGHRWAGIPFRLILLFGSLVTANVFLHALGDVYGDRYNLAVLPLVIILGAVAMARCTAHSPAGAWRRAVLGCLGVCVVTFGSGAAGGYGDNRVRCGDDPAVWADPVRRWTDPDSIVASNQSAAISWYTGRRTIRLPHPARMVLELDDNYLRVDAILIAPGRRYGAFERWSDGSDEFRRRFFRLTTLADGSVLYLRRTGPQDSGPASALVATGVSQ